MHNGDNVSTLSLFKSFWFEKVGAEDDGVTFCHYGYLYYCCHYDMEWLGSR